MAAWLRPQTNLFSGLFYKGDLVAFGPKGLLLTPTAELGQMRHSIGECAPKTVVPKNDAPASSPKAREKAVLVSGLTAITGFGALLVAKYQGIENLGEVMSAGIPACMIAALTVLPAVLSPLLRRLWAVRFLQATHFGFR